MIGGSRKDAGEQHIPLNVFFTETDEQTWPQTSAHQL